MNSFIAERLFTGKVHAAGRDLQQAAGLHCSEMSNIYNCFVGGKQMGSVCINQCTNPRNPLFCTNCEDPADLCSKVGLKSATHLQSHRP